MRSLKPEIGPLEAAFSMANISSLVNGPKYQISDNLASENTLTKIADRKIFL